MRYVPIVLLAVSAIMLPACGGGDGNAGVLGGLAPPLPTLTGVAPPAGDPAGSTVITLTGTNLSAGMSVLVGGAPATGVTFLSTTTITATTPPGVGTVDIVATNVFGSAMLPASFTYGATLTAVAPTMGPEGGGTALTLTGVNFAAPASVTVGGQACSAVLVVNPMTITCTVPPGVGVVDVVVVTSGGASTLPGGYTYIPAPILTAVVPNTGTTDGGTPVTLTGTGFLDNAAGPNLVMFGALAAGSVATIDDTTITCVTPPGAAGPIDVSVTNANGTTTLLGGFTYVFPELYAADGRDGNAGNLYRIDPATAGATTVGPIGVPITGLAFHPNGTLYAVESAQSGLAAINPPPVGPVTPRLFTINTSTGHPTVIGPLVDAAFSTFRVADIAFAGDRLLGVSRNPGGPRLVEISTTTGLVTPTANNVTTSFGMGNVASDALDAVFWARFPADLGELYNLDAVTGASTFVAATSGYVDPGISPRWNSSTFLGGVYYLVGTSCRIPVCGGTTALTTMDPVTGVATLVGIIPLDVDAVAGTVR